MNAITTSRLPDGWSTPEAIEDKIVAGGIAIHRAGFSTTFMGRHEVCGSAADWGKEVSSRAWFELLERVGCEEAIRSTRGSYQELRKDGTVTGRTWSAAEVFPESEVPERWRYARSNGIALQRGWTEACERAYCELAERDRVIRSWYGEIRPERLPIDVIRIPLRDATHYDWRLYAFPEADHSSFSFGTEVVGVFGFPCADDRPFVLGLSARSARGDAIDAAAAEAIQQLAFLWGEPVPEEIPTQPGPMQHLERYQMRGAHQLVLRWLEGAHLYHSKPRSRSSSAVAFVDLTPAWFEPGLRIAKAICSDAVPLIFGDSPLAAHMPAEIRLHPIA